MTPIRPPAVIAAMVAALAVAACGSGGSRSADGTATGARPATVAVRTFQFQPGTLEVSPGTVVRWTNEDDIEHTVTDGAPDTPSGRFDGELAGRGSTVDRAFDEAGTHDHSCRRHPSMTGRVVVR